MPEIMPFMFYINEVIDILKILIPIIIIATSSYHLFKNNYSCAKKNIIIFLSKLLISIAIFLIPTIVAFVGQKSANKYNVFHCFIVNSQDEIYASYAEKMLNKAKASLDSKDYDNALFYITKLKNKSYKDTYENSLTYIKNLIDNKRNNTPFSGNIFVGDSRTLSYSYQVPLKSTDIIYATTSGASKEFAKDFGEALNKINSDNVNRYNLIFNYGVNNLNEDWVSIYKKAIEEVGNKANILIVSVNPCNDNIAKSCRNANIEKLNNKLKNAFSKGYTNVKYCDTYTPFINTLDYSDMIENVSGIHYTEKGTKLIYNNIEKCLNL